MEGLTNKQIQWAMDHDWFHSADYDKGCVTVREYVIDVNTGEYEKHYHEFKDYAKLRKWAGY